MKINFRFISKWFESKKCIDRKTGKIYFFHCWHNIDYVFDNECNCKYKDPIGYKYKCCRCKKTKKWYF